MEGINSERPVSRRYVQSPRLAARLASEVKRVADVIHAERVREWAARDDGDYPRTLEARALAEAECMVLIRALGSWIELEPDQFERDAADHPETWRGVR